MDITVRYFAITREKTGTDHDTLSIPEGSTLDNLWEVIAAKHPSLAPLKRHIRLAVGVEFAKGDHLLQPGDVVALIPPVAGGSPRCWLTEEPLHEPDVRRIVERPEAGAVVVFHGVVRDHTGPHKVSHLEYEVYLEMAQAKLEAICCEVEQEHPQCQVAIAHRYGKLAIGESSVIIAASSPHRKVAFAACQMTIERLKEDVPIWKKEVRHDGSVWVGMGS